MKYRKKQEKQRIKNSIENLLTKDDTKKTKNQKKNYLLMTYYTFKIIDLVDFKDYIK